MNGFLDLFQDYQKEVLGGLALVLALAGGTYYYRYSRMHREEQAHIALSETLHEFNRALRDQTTWEEVSLAAHTGYRQHKNSSLAPYFLSIEADAAIHKGNLDEALKVMDIVFHELSSFSPLYHPLKLKHARILIDSTDENLSRTGFKELETLAHDATAHNTVQDAALYYLGSYHAAHNEMARAKELWKNLVERFGVKKEGEVSPWAELAQTHLQ